MAPSPVVARWELSRRLAARRKELGVDVKTITGELGFSRNYWSAVENDRTLIAEDKLRRLFPLLDFSDQDQSELLQLREDSRKRGWWDEYPTLGDDYKRFFGMEAGAARVRAYDGHLITGILQIEPYARAVIAPNPDLSPVAVDQVAAVRRRRQHELLDTDPPSLTVLLSEAALRQQVAGPEVQVAQLHSLEALVGSPQTDITMRVLPFDLNPGAIINSTTLLFLEYQSPHLPNTAWQEGVQLLGDVEDDEQYRGLDVAWDDGLRRSLDPGSSIDMLRRVISEFEAL